MSDGGIHSDHEVQVGDDGGRLAKIREIGGEIGKPWELRERRLVCCGDGLLQADETCPSSCGDWRQTA